MQINPIFSIAYLGVQHMLCFCFVFLRLVYLMLPFSLDCLFFMRPSWSWSYW